MDEKEVECKAGTYPNLDDIIVEDEGPTLLLPCIVCNKTFKPEALQRHSKVCEKNTHKKRRTFDSFKQRVKGTDLAEFLPYSTLQKRASITEKPPSPKKTVSSWKETHEAFVSAIRAARGEGPDTPGGSGDSRSLLRPPDHEQCPYCERHFGKKSFDRHQEWCREHHSRQPPVTASLQAKERLEARIKYRAPPIKSKRAITREKYSPLVQRKVRQVSPSSNFSISSTTASASSSAGSSRHTHQSQLEQSNRLTRSGNSLTGRSQAKELKESPSSLGFNRGMAARTSLRASQRSMQRPTSPSKRSLGSSKLPGSSAQKSNQDESQSGNHKKEDLMVTSTSLRKLQAKSQTSKLLDEKLRKYSHSTVPSAYSQNLHVEVNAKESKENSNNSKSSKNEQAWRCSSKGEAVKRKNKFQPRTNSVDVNSSVSEMIVTQCVQHKGTNYHQSDNRFCSLTMTEGDEQTSNTDPYCIDGMYLNGGRSCADSSSMSNFRYSSETLTSSTHSADSNRTYVTQSSLCCKADKLYDIDRDELGKNTSSSTVKSGLMNLGLPLPKHNRILRNSGHIPLMQSVSQQTDGDFWETPKRTLCEKSLQGSSNDSDNDKPIPRKQVNFSQSRKIVSNRGIGSKSLSYVTPIPSPRLPMRYCDKNLNFFKSEDPSSGSDTFWERKSDSLNTTVKNDYDNCSAERNFLPCIASSFSTCSDITKTGSKTRQYMSFNSHSRANQLNKNDFSNQQNEEGSDVIQWYQTGLASDNVPRRDRSKQLVKLECYTVNEACNAQYWSSYNHIQNGDTSGSSGRQLECAKGKLSHIDRQHSLTCAARNGSCLTDTNKESMKESVPLLPKLPSPSHQKPFSFQGHVSPSLTTFRSSTYMSKIPSSVILEPLPCNGVSSANRQEEPYDPYASAERQMMELLRSDSACNLNQKQKSPSPAPSISPPPSPTLSPKPSLETSPTSAFTRYAKEIEFPSQTQIGTEAEDTEKSKMSENRIKREDLDKAEQNNPVVNSDVQPNHQPSTPNVSVPNVANSNQPQPPPRSNRRLAFLPHPKNLDELVVSGVGASRPHLKSSHSIDSIQNKLNNSACYDLDNRPKTYDVETHSKKDSEAKDDWCDVSDESLLRDFEFPTIINSADGGKVEVLNLDNRDTIMERRETRESREIREITEHESNIPDIDNLLEEVVRMQKSVSMLSEVDPAYSKEIPHSVSHSSARSRRNRTGKMHIEDFLFPAELLEERENNNFRTSVDSSDRSNSVFGSTKSRKSSSKGRRLIEDMLFPPAADFNANSDINEEGDVVVSSNALGVTCATPEGFNLKMDTFASHYSTSPVALTSKAPNADDGNDGLPRPKPMSLSAHSSTRNGCKERTDKDITAVPTSPVQPPNQSRQSASSRLSADSAYSSLNRRSPVPQVRRQCSAGAQDVHRHGAESPQSILSQSLTQSLVLSSSGSESSLPPLSTSQSKRGGRGKNDCDTPSSDIVSATTPLFPKLSKFCHQCGTKFLISVARFCHECGVARLEIC